MALHVDINIYLSIKFLLSDLTTIPACYPVFTYFSGVNKLHHFTSHLYEKNDRPFCIYYFCYNRICQYYTP
jgi:hypothetical protein